MRPLPSHIAELLDQAADRHGVDRFLARGVAWVESRGEPGATSPKGAMGVMQLMPGTAEGLGVSDPYEPEQNVNAGVRYLAKLLADHQRVRPALAGYVWGPARVRRNPSQSAWPESVRTYVSRVLARADQERQAAGDPSSSSSTSSRPAPSSIAPMWRAVGVVGVLGLGLLYLGLLTRGGRATP